MLNWLGAVDVLAGDLNSMMAWYHYRSGLIPVKNQYSLTHQVVTVLNRLLQDHRRTSPCQTHFHPSSQIGGYAY
ncbi:hypothetical protein GPY51_03655 [Photorhabdus laumondii subsp. laumondii]|nr:MULTISPECIES: hypothetical protein [Photorhabdus]MCC8390833.1 hypothetical protein [Photorhabdus laumondii]MCC8415635.1 hypothetical protein [Photorhabdus laumondii]MCZ1250342.1 hypothetical protein [Photorhabdus laumondii subsp. laumondii]NDK93536.1 hypothetical protein [Photorhabdus laumondii subsp. laumondii]NDL14608.1 hypothetical protein [Photorhabdus laumondii subsp. laumondii]